MSRNCLAVVLVLGVVDMTVNGDAAARKDAAGNVVIRTKPHPAYEAGDRMPEI